MKNNFFLLALMILCSSYALSQQPEKEYVLSFPYDLKDTILISQRLIHSKNAMTKMEALAFVYHNDSNMLVCEGEYYDMYAEKVTGKWKEERLPKKCMGLKTDFFYLIAFTSYECQDPDARQWEYLNLALYDERFNLKDTLIAYKGDEYDYEISSIINVKTEKLFLYRFNSISKLKEFYIMRVNPNTLKFEFIKMIESEDDNSDNLIKTLQKLSLENLFYQ